MTPHAAAPVHTAASTAVATVDTGIVLMPDPARVVTRFFVPGREDVGPGDSRAAPVIERLLELDDAAVEATMLDITYRFGDRHPSLDDTFEEHAATVLPRIESAEPLTPARRRLLGAAFTHEYAVEAAALCNPSIVLHPAQPSDGDTAFVLSVRGIGEGHRSSIGFRTGRVSPVGEVFIDAPGPFPRIAAAGPGVHRQGVLHRKLRELGDDHENAAFVLDPLPECFTDDELHARIEALGADAATRRNTAATTAHLLHLQRCSYTTAFPTSTELSERILWPQSPDERHGMEDARFVRFVEEDGSSRYYATYTAFDGSNISVHLLTTDEFESFDSTPLAGEAAMGKGLALFPRRIGGRFAALTRSDRETNSVAFSDDLHLWDTSTTVQVPSSPWEILQLGNCGSPIETDDGWLVLTHGVGPMRSYSIGAILLDLDEPDHVLARCTEPVVRPDEAAGNGYVPNVVYTCGALAVGDRLVLPYGVGDQRIAIATLSVSELIASMQRV